MLHFVPIGLMPSTHGMGIYLQHWVRAGTRILTFSGSVVDRDFVLRVQARGYIDSFLQIGENEFLGASGRMDDYVNHSCTPNCGLEFEDGIVYLTSLASINRGEELTFDYATSQHLYPYRFNCHCGTVNCRGEIGDFVEVSAPRQEYYRSLSVVAPFLHPGSEPRQPEVAACFPPAVVTAAGQPGRPA